MRLLANVFETFRDLCLDDYEIDPFHKVSLPGFTFQAASKYKNIKLELLQDYDIHLFIEKGIRGGVSTISTR